MPEAITVPTTSSCVIALLDAEAMVLAEIGGAFGRLFRDGGDRDALAAIVVSQSAESRAIVRDAFRGADDGRLATLLENVEGIVTALEQAARAVRRYGLAEFDASARQLAHDAVDALDDVATALPLLRAPERYGEPLRALAMGLYAHRARADDVEDAGLQALFAATGGSGAFAAHREVYGHLRTLADRLEAVARILEAMAD